MTLATNPYRTLNFKWELCQSLHNSASTAAEPPTKSSLPVAASLWSHTVRGGCCYWTTSVLPVQTQSVRSEEDVLGHVPTRDVHQDVSCHHPHERRPPTDAAGAGEARPLHGAGASHRFVDGERQDGRGRHRLWGADREGRIDRIKTGSTKERELG